MPIQKIANKGGFSNLQELIWNQRSDSAAGASLDDGSDVSSQAGVVEPFSIGHGPLIINATGKEALVRLNRTGINVNFEDGEVCLAAKYPSGRTMPENTPVVLEFSDPVAEVGTYVSILGARRLYDGRDMLGIMWVQLDGELNTWHLAVDHKILEKFVKVGAPVTAPFVAAKGVGAKIRKIWFDASLAGNFDSIVISRLYWSP
jgi:hypothetical protein